MEHQALSGYKQSKSEYSLHTKSTGPKFTVILVYVDALVLRGLMLMKLPTLRPPYTTNSISRI